MVPRAEWQRQWEALGEGGKAGREAMLAAFKSGAVVLEEERPPKRLEQDKGKLMKTVGVPMPMAELGELREPLEASKRTAVAEASTRAATEKQKGRKRAHSPVEGPTTEDVADGDRLCVARSPNDGPQRPSRNRL